MAGNGLKVLAAMVKEVFINKPNLETMTQQELQKYILEHRDDEDAVHEAVLRIQEHGTTVSSEEFIEIVRQRTNNPPQPQ